jgi:hypothetical protein
MCVPESKAVNAKYAKNNLDSKFNEKNNKTYIA